MIAAVGMSGAQTNKISGALTSTFSLSESVTAKLIIGIIVAAFVAFVIIGEIKRIGKVASYLVPFMSLLFIILAMIVIITHISALPSAFALIFKHAFNFKAAGNGILGYAFSQVIRMGMARGVFSNEAGLGSSVIAHCASETREPVKQGLWGIFEVFFDTFIICTLTALMFLTSVDVTALTGTESDSATSLMLFSDNFGTFGTVAYSIILPLFAFTTIIAWSYYGEKATEFLFHKTGEKGKRIAVLCFKIIYVLLIISASVMSSPLAWALSDTSNGLMAIPNLIGVVGLSGLVVKITKNYYERKKNPQVKPMLSAYEDLNEEFAQDIINENK